MTADGDFHIFLVFIADDNLDKNCNPILDAMLNENL